MNKVFRISSRCALISIALAATLTSCALKDRVTSVNKTFLEDVDISTTHPNLPFDHAWTAPGFNKAHYTQIYFKPIRLDYLPKGDWAKSSSPLIKSEDEYLQKAREIAEYFRDELIIKTRNSKVQKLRVAGYPAPETLVVEIALTELELSHPIARAGSLVAPVPGTGAALSTVSDPHVAFAARVYDGSSGQLVATAADKKFAPARIVDLNKLTVSSSPREICSLWSDTLAAALQGDGKTKISEKRFDWMPW